ncbi:hypothetical protein V1502_10145 [Bacillus sp. SCS-153A]|uniref:hypothetical protein n=1 Tax=Rossellomorea sedimentorum TaxID=3115294 RepID=UPI003905A730
MKLVHIFSNALRLPQKKARLYLNKTNLTETLLYLFSLVIIMNLPGFAGFFLNGAGGSDDLFFLQYVILGPFFSAFTVLAGISVASMLLLGLAGVMKRKLKYQYLWKMAAFSLPLPILSAYLADLIIGNDALSFAVFLFIFFSIHFKMIRDFPKRKHN